MNTALIGLITGLAFGFLLQRARVLRYDKQVAALRLIDMTIVKFMLSAVLVGMIGIHLLDAAGAGVFDIKPLKLGANILGGIVFGIGWGILGYCPGTAVGALGEGRWDAVWGILGMLAGGAVFAVLFPWLENHLMSIGDFGKVTLPQLLGISPWPVIAVFAAGGVFLLRWLEKKGVLFRLF